jgi:hypothetical protein
MFFAQQHIGADRIMVKVFIRVLCAAAIKTTKTYRRESVLARGLRHG